MSRAMLQNLVFSALVGLVAGISPLTTNHVLESSLAGLATGAAVFFYRARGQQRLQQEARAMSGAPEARGATPPTLLPAVALLMSVAVFSPTLVWMFERWTSSIWQNAHGLFVPFIMAYLAHSSLSRGDFPDEPGSSWGFLFVVPALALVVVDSAIGTKYLSSIALVLCLPGLSLLLLGTHRTKAIIVPLVLGVFMVPIPNTVATHLYLKTLSAAAVEPLIWQLGIPVLREQTTLVLPERAFVVGDACSGFATLYAAVGVSLLLACYCHTHLRRALVIVAALPLALTANIVRVLILVLLAHFFGVGLLDTPLHSASGVATFWTALGGLFLVAGRDTLRRTFA